MEPVPPGRIRPLNTRAVDPAGTFVLYWMVSARRLLWNFALQRAVHLCLELQKPLLVLEPLDADYPWASDRLHRFVLDGMHANAADAAAAGAAYLPYVEPAPAAGRGLVAALGRTACAVVTDDYPAFFLPKILARAAAELTVAVEAVDSNGLIPLAAHPQTFTSARAYRAFVQRELRTHLRACPDARPLEHLPRHLRAAPVPAAVQARWPAAAPDLLDRRTSTAHLHIDHAVIE